MSFSTQDTIVAIATPPGRADCIVGQRTRRAHCPGAITHRDPFAAAPGDVHEGRPATGNPSAADAWPEPHGGADQSWFDHVVTTSFRPAPYTG
jgi:hypothetical protein